MPLRPVAPRASFACHHKLSQHPIGRLPLARHASTTPPPPPKPRVLAKPERFNPPSHPSRIRRKPKYYGPELGELEREAQKKRHYPHMMPPEGTFMYWFLTNRRIHMYITITTLISLVCIIWYQDFVYKTPYLDLLPPASTLIAHPIAFFQRYAEVYAMHVYYVSAQAAERRRRHFEDVANRAEYRKKHGIEPPVTNLLTPWLGESMKLGVDDPPVAASKDDKAEVGKSEARQEEAYLDFDGKPQPARKKIFGIW